VSAGTGSQAPRRRSLGARLGLARIEESLRAQSLFVTAAQGLQALFALGVPVVLARVLDQEAFGAFRQIGLLASTALAVLTLGLPGSLFYFVPRSPEASQSILRRTAWLLAALGAAGGLLLALAAPSLEQAFSAPLGRYALFLGAFVALAVPGSLVEVAAVVDRRPRLTALGVGLIEALRGALLVGVALVTRDLVAVLAALVAAVSLRGIAVAGYLIWRRGQHPGADQPFAWRPHLAYALPFFGAALIGLSRDQLHAYFVATQYSAAQFAIYAVGTLTVPLVDKLIQSVAEVMVIHSARHLADGRLDEVRRARQRATWALALAIVPIVLILEVFAEDVIGLLYGAPYRPAAPVFRVFLLLLVLQIPLSSAMLRSSASLRTMILADVASLVATIGTLALAAGPLGPVGATASLVAGNAVFHAIASLRVRAQLDLAWRDFLEWGRLLRLVALCGACTGIALLATGPLPAWLRALAGPALAAGLCAAALWRTTLLPESERDLARRLAARGLALLAGRGASR
jgi:O-antigen/teichoic acid export membrane protein